MKAKVKNNGRDKKFIGAAIGAVANIAGGIIGARKRKKQAKKQAAANAANIAAQAEVDAQQQAAAMSSSYENQDYVDEFKNKISLKNGGKLKGKDRVAVAKKYAMGGRKKKLFGMSDEQMAKANQAVSLFDTIGTAATNIATGGQSNIKPTTNYSELTTANNLQRNKEIAHKAEEAKTKGNNTSIMKAGGRKKKGFGDVLGQVGGAAGGLSGLVSSIAGPKEKVNQGDTIKKAYSYNAPKTGLARNSYSTDANGNPINSTTKDGVIGTMDARDNQFRDRLATARMGCRKRKK